MLYDIIQVRPNSEEEELFFSSAKIFNRDYPTWKINLEMDLATRPSQELDGTKVKMFIVIEDDKVLARCALFEYSDGTAAFGLFECQEKCEDVFNDLMETIEQRAIVDGYQSIRGPIDITGVLRRSFKTSRLDDLPHIDEPTNPNYYPQWFEKRGYSHKRDYVSNCYDSRNLRHHFKECFEDYKNRNTRYTIKTPRCFSYALTDIFKVVKEKKKIIGDEALFSQINEHLRKAVPMHLVKIAYDDETNEPIGCLAAAYDLGQERRTDIVARMKNKFFSPDRYVVLWFATTKPSETLESALFGAFLTEVERKPLPIVGPLVYKNSNYADFGDDHLISRTRYVLYEKKFTLAAMLDCYRNVWGKQERFVTCHEDYDRLDTTSGGRLITNVIRAAEVIKEISTPGDTFLQCCDASQSSIICDLALMASGRISAILPENVKEHVLRDTIELLSPIMLLYTEYNADLVMKLGEEYGIKTERIEIYVNSTNYKNTSEKIISPAPIDKCTKAFIYQDQKRTCVSFYSYEELLRTAKQVPYVNTLSNVESVNMALSLSFPYVELVLIEMLIKGYGIMFGQRSARRYSGRSMYYPCLAMLPSNQVGDCIKYGAKPSNEDKQPNEIVFSGKIADSTKELAEEYHVTLTEITYDPRPLLGDGHRRPTTEIPIELEE